MRAVGYRQVWQYLAGAIGRAELPERGAAATRQLAKRQLTWLRGWPWLCRMTWGPPERLAIDICSHLEAQRLP